jgi:hypothetical protein
MEQFHAVSVISKVGIEKGTNRRVFLTTFTDGTQLWLPWQSFNKELREYITKKFPREAAVAHRVMMRKQQRSNSSSHQRSTHPSSCDRIVVDGFEIQSRETIDSSDRTIVDEFEIESRETADFKDAFAQN